MDNEWMYRRMDIETSFVKSTRRSRVDLRTNGND